MLCDAPSHLTHSSVDALALLATCYHPHDVLPLIRNSHLAVDLDGWVLKDLSCQTNLLRSGTDFSASRIVNFQRVLC